MDQAPQRPSRSTTPPPFRPPATPQPVHTATGRTPAKQQVLSRPTGSDPGMVLAIIGIVLAFFLSLVGIVLSIIARKRSLRAGFSGTLGTIGIILNTVFLALTTLVIGFIIIVAMVFFQGVQERADAARARSEAQQQEEKAAEHEARTTHEEQKKSIAADSEQQLVEEDAERARLSSSIADKLTLYHTTYGTLPVSIDQFSQQSTVPLAADEVDALTDAYIRTEERVINITLCKDNSGAYVGYWSNQLGRLDLQVVPADANPMPPCNIMPLTEPTTP